jgi:hypothetical protein
MGLQGMREPPQGVHACYRGKKYWYVIAPDEVHSRFDSDIHYIDAATLAMLYRVDMDWCYIWVWQVEPSIPAELSTLPVLRPDYRGRYQLPRSEA